MGPNSAQSALAAFGGHLRLRREKTDNETSQINQRMHEEVLAVLSGLKQGGGHQGELDMSQSA